MKMSIQNQHKEEYKETTVLVAEINGRIEAYTVAWLVGDELQVIDLAVDKAWRRHGLGKLLMERLIKMWYAWLHAASRNFSQLMLSEASAVKPAFKAVIPCYCVMSGRRWM